MEIDWTSQYLGIEKLLLEVGPLEDKWYASHLEQYVEAVWENLTPAERKAIWARTKVRSSLVTQQIVVKELLRDLSVSNPALRLVDIGSPSIPELGEFPPIPPVHQNKRTNNSSSSIQAISESLHASQFKEVGAKAAANSSQLLEGI